VSHFSKKLDLSPQQLQDGLPGKPAPIPFAHVPSSKNVAAPLPMKQRQLLEFIIAYPEYLQGFLEAGVEDFVVDPCGQEIINLLKANNLAGLHSDNPEKLLEIAAGAPRAFISKVLISTPVLTDEVKEKIAQEWTQWLRKSSMKIKKNSLIHLITEAHKNRNAPLYMELMEQKKQMDETLNS
jgi:DNA primase